MRFASYNIQYGMGKDQKFDLQRIADELEDAEVIALQEVDRYWSRSGMVDQAQELANLLGEYHWVYGPGIDLDASHVNDDGHFINRRRQFGNMILSKSPILSSRTHLLPKYATLGPMSLQRCALEATINTEAGLLRLYSVHLTHLAKQTRLPQIERLLSIHHNAAQEGAAITGSAELTEWLEGVPESAPRNAIIMGDFNADPSTEEYDRMVGPSSIYGGRMTNPDGFVDAWVAVGNAESDGFTAHQMTEKARLDYIFVSTELRSLIAQATIDKSAQGSDHQPMWMDIDL